MTESTITLILGIFACLMTIYCVWQVSSINKMRKSFFAGKQALNLESVIIGLEQGLKTQSSHTAALEQTLTELKHNSTFAVQKVGLVRFNPFGDGGGNFSFSLALLDSHNTGVIITSMYGREQNRIYTKKIHGGKSDTALNEEEQKAVQEANSKS